MSTEVPPPVDHQIPDAQGAGTGQHPASPLARIALPGEARVLEAAQRSLTGEHRGLKGALPFLGPAFIASIAYIDPGNFATNIAAGAQFGYALLWVIVMSNLMAMLVQSMSAKLGIATGMNLAEACRARYGTKARISLWLMAELVAMATDLAEFIGGAVALNLLFDMPLLWGAVVVGVVAFGLLALQEHGFHKLERVIVGFVGFVVIGFIYELVLAKPDGGAIAHGMFIPHLSNTESILLASGIIGATVMPHVIYLHSALTQDRVVGTTPDERKRIYRFELIDVVIAMSIAGFVNISMLVIAAATFHGTGGNFSSLDAAYNGFGTYLGHHADIVFGLALLACGLSSSSIGTMAGQVVMQGFLQRSIPLMLRRLITMVPAFVIIGIGLNPTRSLIMSQVVLSFGIPFALLPLLAVCRDKRLMGELVNKRITTALATVVVTIIISLNVFLLQQTFLG
ncbi:MAG: Nramp family divalent metal transporter [Thermoleophilia bacterium]|nr:Nramp family divalent metal transporter [Thermoleophilia bacterium]